MSYSPKKLGFFQDTRSHTRPTLLGAPDTARTAAPSALAFASGSLRFRSGSAGAH
ncbi:hypothetical protein [Streptomyces longwoodensis]|uniref:hypothetical protein n=1 Tax=Streptomyces longwoodensis TaxID=68231 RepID=UPI0033C709E1